MSLINLTFYVLDILILAASSIGNVLVIVIIRETKVFGQSSASTLMIALAVADFITDACAIPFCIFVVNNENGANNAVQSPNELIFTECELRVAHQPVCVLVVDVAGVHHVYDIS